MPEQITLYNTLTRRQEIFVPFDGNEVRMYTCGPTVYNFAHIGNLRSYVFADLLCRTLRYGGYKLKQVMNITDIGHLASDADSGEDKMTKGLLREGKELTLENMRMLAEFYTERFKENLEQLNIQMPDGLYYASDHIAEDIELIDRLEKKGYTYKTIDGVYFDISKMPDYGMLTGDKGEWTSDGARVKENMEKRNPEDFALWKLNTGIGFESPWGRGFPGWHIECSAMSMKYLGEQFDIHTGGIDHISIHHTNEIAQSECATGKKPFVKLWMHHEHVDISGAKMAKSDENFLRLQSIIDKGINPLAYRFWLLMASYRKKMNFSMEALAGSEVALKRLYALFLELGGDQRGKIIKEYQEKFSGRVRDDLDTPGALVVLWDVLKDARETSGDKRATVLDFDRVLGLGFADLKKEEVPEEVSALAQEREQARAQKDFKKSDELRERIKKLGWEASDTDDGQSISKI